MANNSDPHAELHEQASKPGEQHPEAMADNSGSETVEEKLVKLDQRLTGRINDLRKDFDQTKQAMSKSVGAFQQALNDLKTATENNKASIEAQNNAIDLAKSKAESAKTAADSATAKANQVGQDLAKLDQEYRVHTHDLTVQFSGQTDPPKGGHK